MKYIFSNDLESNFNGNYVSYYHKKHQSDGGFYININKYIFENQEKWLADLEEWHSQLCKIGANSTPYWWMLDGSRFYTWSPAIYSPFIYAIAVNNYCDYHNIEHLTLLDCPKEVYVYLKEIDSSAVITLQNNYNQNKLIKTVYWNNILKSFFEWLIVLINSLKYLFKKKDIIHNERILIFSQIFEKIEEKKVVDHYYGNIFNQNKNDFKKIILWVFQYNVKFSSKKILNNIPLLNNKNYIITSQLNSTIDIIKILFIYLHLIIAFKKIKKRLPKIKINEIKSKILPREYFSLMLNGILPLQELLIYNAFKKLIKINNNIDTIIYPYEEKSLERAILLSTINNSNITTIGYSHSVHWNLHYYFHVRSSFQANPPRPDIHAVTGDLEKWWLNNIAAVPEHKIKVLGSNRYVHKMHSAPKCSYDTHNMKILVVVGQSCDLRVLANYLEDEPDIFSQCDLLIRKYPFSWDKEQENGISMINNYVTNIEVNNQDLLQNQIEWCDIMLYNTSSCGIIAMLSGRIAVNVALHDILYWNPLEKQGSKNAIIHCMSAVELHKSVKELKKLDTVKYKKTQAKQMNYAKNVYSAVNREVLNELLKL
jgi:hypothetical protein